MNIDNYLIKLKRVIPDNVLAEVKNIKEINGPLRLSHFLSQCSHESNDFKIVNENLNYSVDRMLQIFKGDFDKDGNKIISETERQKAISIKGSPEKIANFVYANQNGNGNELSGDGWKFSGKGYIQLTGRDNYIAFDKTVDDDIISNPYLVTTKYPLQSAAFFFTKNNLWKICDKGNSIEVVKELTKRINGGLNGIDDRILRFNKIYKLITT